jgi:predicted transcriptional regulator
MKRLEAYAKASGRSKSWIVEDSLDRYVEQEKAFADAVNIGLWTLASVFPMRRRCDSCEPI